MRERLEIIAKRDKEDEEQRAAAADPVATSSTEEASTSEEPSTKRSRRGSKPVDYQALAVQLEQEKAMKD